MVLIGVGCLVALIVAVASVVAMRLARKDAAENREPRSVPGDFLAPVSSGGYRFRGADESESEFRARIARENAPA